MARPRKEPEGFAAGTLTFRLGDRHRACLMRCWPKTRSSHELRSFEPHLSSTSSATLALPDLRRFVVFPR